MNKLPIGPNVPSWLQLIQWIRAPLSYLEKCAQCYGDTFTIRVFGSNPFVILSHPQAIQVLFSAPPGQFNSGRGNNIVRPLVGDNSMLLLDGDRHLTEAQTPHASLFMAKGCMLTVNQSVR